MHHESDHSQLALSNRADVTLDVPRLEEEEPSGRPNQGGASLFAALRRHWWIAALCFPVFAGIAIPPIWLTIKPTYSATAQIKVDPILSTPFDRHMSTIPMFDSFLQSQVVLMKSGPVLEEVAKDPSLKPLPIMRAANVPQLLRAKLDIEPVPRTQIIQLKVTDQDPQAAVIIANAVQNAYLTLYGGTAEIDKNIEFLAAREADLRQRIEAQRKKKLDLGGEYQATTEDMIAEMRKQGLKSSEQTREDLENTDLQLMQIQLQLDQMQAGRGLPEEGLSPSEQEAAIALDPAVKSLQEQLLADTDHLNRLRRVLSDQAPEVVATKRELARFNKELEAARLKAITAYMKDRQAVQANLRQRQLDNLTAKLDFLKGLREKLAARIAEQDATDKRMGQVSIGIQTIDDELIKLEKELDQTEAARKNKEIEKSQPGPGRVSRASAAEIMPDGYSDRRPKLTIAALGGSLFAALALALLRGRFDVRLHAPTELEAGLGLRILGAVPALNDLKRGRITQEEFQEAYRLVRINILSRIRGEQPKSILVTSALASEGKTSLAVSLAFSLSELGKRVLLVDGDMQVPKIGKLLGLEATFCLPHVLSGVRDVKEAATPSRHPNLDVLLGAVSTGSHYVELHNVKAILGHAADKYDFVVIDSAPALGTADALVWSQVVDSVILSTLVGASNMRATQHVCERLAMVGARLLGAVVCNVPLRTSSSAYSWDSYSTSRTSSQNEYEYGSLPYLVDSSKRRSSS